MTSHKIFLADSRRMLEIADNSVDLVITSPPYWQLKDYGNSEQLGFGDTYEEYINNLDLVWQECFRVLNPGCRLCINIGDQFARAVYYGRYKIIPIRTEIIKFCETVGFDYMGAIIWQKVTNTNTTGGASIMGSYPYPRNGILKIDYEFILIFKKQGRDKRKIDKDAKESSKMSKEEWKEYFSGHWKFSGARQGKHLAMFPEELPKRLIKMFSFKNETVLDPFMGSGTTALAAKNLGRNSFGYESNAEFKSLIMKKHGWDEPDLFKDYELIFEERNKQITDFKKYVNGLPYVFVDPIKINSRIDPRKLSFGSKITKDDKDNTNYHSVKKIISPVTMKLDNNIKIKLIGLKERIDKKDEAIDYLRKVLDKQRIYLKFDKQKYDKEQNLLCYLYLKNKTFINAHLLKNDLVDISEDEEFSKRSKFLKLWRENGKRMDS